MIDLLLNGTAILFLVSTLCFFTVGLWALLGSDNEDN